MAFIELLAVKLQAFRKEVILGGVCFP